MAPYIDAYRYAFGHTTHASVEKAVKIHKETGVWTDPGKLSDTEDCDASDTNMPVKPKKVGKKRKRAGTEMGAGESEEEERPVKPSKRKRCT
ncbi:hypothetical protein OEA41_009721 [Lepraria neglecta]|uniref:Uncharacterized protein n=1 Tax=Lepraria neglecta TaxID=209136 RepID=A0AAE0DI13_9LECA|nr:hypothetical protein OEA41_009721 [Lepraria neglecta]